MRVYISGPLQGSTDLHTARHFYDQVADCVNRAGHEAYVPHHYTDPQHAGDLSAEVVFERDLDALRSCDAIVAHIGLPSTGVGAEIALAVADARPVLAIKRNGEKSSRFTEGLLLRAGDRVYTFADIDDLGSHIELWLDTVHSSAHIGRHLRVSA